MSFDKLPAEIRLKIANQVDILDIFSLVRVSKSWRNFIGRQASLLPRYEFSSIRIEEFDFVRFKFKAHVVRVQPNEKTQLKYYYFRTDNDLWLFLQFLRVTKSLYLKLLFNIDDLVESICSACRDIHTISVRIDSPTVPSLKVSADSLRRICNGLPKLDTLIIEDASKHWDDDAYPVISTIKEPKFVEARSGKSQSKLKITDKTLLHLASLSLPFDAIVLSTDRSSFSLDAVRQFLQNAEFVEHGLVELFYIDCTTNAFFNLLSDMQISFESEPLRGIFNSFPIILKGKPVCLNIKYFSDSHNRTASS